MYFRNFFIVVVFMHLLGLHYVAKTKNWRGYLSPIAFYKLMGA
jgi:hypothetical protein